MHRTITNTTPPGARGGEGASVRKQHVEGGEDKKGGCGIRVDLRGVVSIVQSGRAGCLVGRRGC